MRSGRVGFDFAAQVADIDPQDVHLVLRSRAPGLFEQLVMSDDLAGILHEQAQNIQQRIRNDFSTNQSALGVIQLTIPFNSSTLQGCWPVFFPAL